MSTIIPINQTNVTTQNNVFHYNFPAGSVNFKDRKIAISSIILPYTWYNITSTYNNQTFQITVPTTDGSSFSTLSITIPAGFYTIGQMNEFLQSVLIANNFYLVNPAGDNVYYIEIVGNTNLSTAQLNCYVVPNTLPTTGGTWTNPGWTLPSTGTRVPQLITDTSNFYKLIGFAPSTTYPSTATQASTYSITSSITPQISPVSCVLVNCSLVNNLLSSPSNIITLIPITSTFGAQIIFTPSTLIWLPILDGSYPYMRISFLDQLSNQLEMTDTNVIISLVIT